ncbi:MAG: Uncharacterized protein XD91_0419 [Clostridiales bacterium 38_11]|nr:MAG: Uncharacterized protein XD91_0419 [Clostridiales bacterium 38_11]HBH12051.1 hypothetical protein [Clostridiales bacterium]
MGYLNNYDVKEVVFENSFQRVSLCVNNQNNTEFFNNIILSPRIIELLDIDLLTDVMPNVLAAGRNDDRAYIATPVLDAITLTEYINTNTLKMRQQLDLTTSLLTEFEKIEVFADLIQEAMTGPDNVLVIDGKIEFKNLLRFSQSYDISESLLVRQAGNYIHCIYTGEFINEFNISERLPPDIARLVVRCYSNQYLNISQVIEAFKHSSTYSLVLVTNNKTPDTDLLLNDDDSFERDETLTDNDPVFFEALESPLEETDQMAFGREKLRLMAIVAIIIIPLMILFLSRCGNNEIEQPTETGNASQTETTVNPSGENGESNNNASDLPETINDFFSKELIELTNGSTTADIDFSRYYDGYTALMIKNDTEKNQKTLFAVVDLNNEKFRYLKEREVGITLRLSSDADNLEGSVIMEVVENNSIVSYSNQKMTLNSTNWKLNLTSIQLGNADRIDMYFEYTSPYSIWIDGIEIDILK